MKTFQLEQKVDLSGQEKLILLFLLSLILLLVFKDFLFLNRLYIFKDIGSDSYNEAWPFFTHVSNYLRADGIPRWSFNKGMGQNIFPGAMHNPFNLLIYLMGEKYIPYGIVYVESLKILIGGIIFFHYLGLLQVAPFIRIIGGILFAFSGYMLVGSGWYGHSSAVVFGIFLFLGFEKLFRENVPYYFPVAVFLVCSRSVFYLYTFGLFLLIYATFRFLDEKGWEIKELFILYSKMAGLGALGLGMVCLFTMNDIFRIIESPRGSGGYSYANTLKSVPFFSFGSKSHNLTAVFSLFSTNILGTGSSFKGWQNYLEAPTFYCGLISLLSAPQFFLISKDKSRRILWLMFLSIWVLIVVFPFFRFAFYLFSGDYFKGGVSFIVSVVLLFFGLLALDDIDKKKQIHLPLLLITLTGCLFFLYFPWYNGEESPVVEIYRQLSAFFLIIDTFLIYLLSKKNAHWAVKFIIILLVVMEAAIFSYDTANKRFTMTADELHKRIGYNDYTLDAISKIKSADTGFFRIIKDYSSGNTSYLSINDSEIQGYFSVFSYYSFNQKFYIRFLSETGVISVKDERSTRWAGYGFCTRPLLLTFVNVKYLLSKSPLPDFYHNTYTKSDTFEDVKLFQNNCFLPMGDTYDSYIRLEDYRKLNQLQKDISFFKAFILEDKSAISLKKDFIRYDISKINTEKNLKTYVSGDYSKDIEKLKADRMEITLHNQNKIAGKINLNKRKLVFFTIPFDKGWHAKIDGREAPLHIVNIGFTGLIVDKGYHNIELFYMPRYFKTGVAVSVLSFLFYIGLIIKGRYYRSGI